MSRKSNKQQQGFTITELLISTVVFSVLLVGLLTSFIRISDLFYKGVTMSKTQEDARNIVQSISDDIQFYASAPDTVQAQFGSVKINSETTSVAEPAFCIGQHRYRFQMGALVDGSNYGLARDTVGGGACPQVGNLPDQVPGGQTSNLQMLDTSMQLNNLSVTCSSGRCKVKIHVIFYGGAPADLFTTPCIAGGGAGCPYTANPWQAPDAQCTGGIESTDLCATVDYDSTVLENKAL